MCIRDRIGDERKLNQILLNLLSNAVKFTPDGGHVLLSIRQRPVREGKVHMTFTVKDTGIGMDEAFLNRVFEPFEQGENIAGKYGGSGLGLAITKNIDVYKRQDRHGANSDAGRYTGGDCPAACRRSGTVDRVEREGAGNTRVESGA